MTHWDSDSSGSRPPPQQGSWPAGSLPQSASFDGLWVLPRNDVGLVGLIVAIVGFVFACIPGAPLIGWVLLPIGFILSVVGLALTEKTQAAALAGLIVSVVGTVAGGLVLMFSIDNVFLGDVKLLPSPQSSAEVDRYGATDDDDQSAKNDGVDSTDQGSRGQPVELGSTVSSPDWDVTIVNFDPQATDAVLAAHELNDPPGEGNVYAMAEVEFTYTGKSSADPVAETDIAYVTKGGATRNFYDVDVLIPEPSFYDIGELYEGTSGTGHVILEIPADDDNGLLRVTPGVVEEDVFVSTHYT